MRLCTTDEAIIGRLHAFVRPTNVSPGPTPGQWCGEAGLPLAGEPSQLTGLNLLQRGCFLVLSGGGEKALLQRVVRHWPAAGAPFPHNELKAELPAEATALIYMSNDLYMESWGFKTSPTALVWRAMGEHDFAPRAVVVQRWAQSYYCGGETLPAHRIAKLCCDGPKPTHPHTFAPQVTSLT